MAKFSENPSNHSEPFGNAISVAENAVCPEPLVLTLRFETSGPSRRFFGPWESRLRIWLKIGLRGFGIRCLTIAPAALTTPKREAQNAD